jgi:hypothetical protein
MTDCHAGAVAVHGAPTRSQIIAMQSEHQAIIRDALAAAEFWGGTRSLVWKQFLAELGRNFQVIYEQGTRTESRLKQSSSLGWRWAG